MGRCHWVDETSEIYIKYHDDEWGVPKYDDRELFELLILEGFQAGLSWITVLKKRDAFKKAFDNFDVQKVANYTTSKIDELLNNKDIIRSRAKINAAIINAQVFIKIQKEFGNFSKYIWKFTHGRVIKNNGKQIFVKSSLSENISKDMKCRGMKYVGPIIVYSYLQAIGIVNDHEVQCFRFNK